MSSREAGAGRPGDAAGAEFDVRPPLPRGEVEADDADPEAHEESREEKRAREFDTRYPPDTGSSADPAETLRAFSRPRMTGTRGADQVREGVIRRLEAMGYETEERPFRFSAVPGRFALPVGGGALALFSVIGAVLIVATRPIGALIVLALGAAITVAVAMFAIPMITRMPWGRIEGRNVLAMPATGRPRYLIMAHMDSKSQLVPLALRAPAVGVLVVGWLALVFMAMATLVAPLPNTPVAVTGVVLLAAGILVALSLADNGSPGALDNASGLAALIAIAHREREHGDIGFIITDAEELGLAGARAIARELPPVFGVLNIDGLDDAGAFHVMERFGWRKRGLAPHMAAALLGAAADMNIPAERRDLPYGIMTDQIPILDAGQPAVTLMRGNMASMRRVHRPGDNLASLSGDGVRQGVELVCAALATLRDQAERTRG